MNNPLSIFFILCCITTNVITASFWQKLNNITEITCSYEEAKKRLSNILPDTLMSEKHRRKYNLLKKLDQQTQEILDYKKSQQLLNPEFKALLNDYMFNNYVARISCETEYTMMPNLHDEDNPHIDGNDFNIMNTYQAYKKCAQEILTHTGMIQ